MSFHSSFLIVYQNQQDSLISLSQAKWNASSGKGGLSILPYLFRSFRTPSCDPANATATAGKIQSVNFGIDSELKLKFGTHCAQHNQVSAIYKEFT